MRSSRKLWDRLRPRVFRLVLSTSCTFGTAVGGSPVTVVAVAYGLFLIGLLQFSLSWCLVAVVDLQVVAALLDIVLLAVRVLMPLRLFTLILETLLQVVHNILFVLQEHLDVQRMVAVMVEQVVDIVDAKAMFRVMV